MFVADLFEDTTNILVVYPGRFQPFHKGHKAVYDGLVAKFGRDRVFIATSNKVDPPRSPFSFSDKSVFMALTGVPMDRVVESREPYKVPELVELYPAEKTVLIFAVSEKDMAEDPRFRMGYKKDGNPTYFQPLPADLKDANTLDQHGYIMTVPTVDFTVLGAPMTSATEVRKQYSESDEETRKKIIADLFGRYSEEARHIMDQKLMVSEGRFSKALGAAALATGLAAGTPAQADITPRDALTALRAAKNIQNISKDSIRGEINQEIGAIARGDRNASALLGRGQRDLDKEKEWLKYDDQSRKTQAIVVIDGEQRVYDLGDMDVRRAGELINKRLEAQNVQGYQLTVTDGKQRYRVNSLGKIKETPNTPIGFLAPKLDAGQNYYKMLAWKYSKNPGMLSKKELNDLRDYIIAKKAGLVEDAAGVGVVASNKKMASDPRYSMSLTKDVKTDTLKKMMRAFNLIESLYHFDPENPMTDSEVLIPGYGRLSISTLHRKLERNFQELSTMMASMDPDAVRRAQYVIKNSPLPVMLDALLQAYRDLSAQRRRGGTKSRGISSGMFADEP
jgi:hypothetical protein